MTGRRARLLAVRAFAAIALVAVGLGGLTGCQFVQNEVFTFDVAPPPPVPPPQPATEPGS